MILDYIIAMLWSISPFGEAKVGITFGLLKGLNIYLVFLLCFAANVLVFPLFKSMYDNIFTTEQIISLIIIIGYLLINDDVFFNWKRFSKFDFKKPWSVVVGIEI